MESPAEYEMEVYSMQDVAADPQLRQEVQRFVDTDISVNYGARGADGGLSNAFKDGLAKPRGWLVVATSTAPFGRSITVHSDVGIRQRRVSVPSGSTVGVILVSAAEQEWNNTRTSRGGRFANLVALAVHQHYVGNYVHERLWSRLKQAIREDDEAGTGTFTLHVRGGPCLNTDQTRHMYMGWGFAGVDQNFRWTTIEGWTLTFTDGTPPPEPRSAEGDVDSLVFNVRGRRTPLRDRASKRE